MRRILSALAATTALLTVAVAPALAGNHSGPDQAAKGTGDTSYTNMTSSPITATICLSDFSFCFPGTQIGSTIVSTAVRESFSFDAKLGPQTSVTDPTNGAYGQMKIDYEATTTTSITNNGFCTNPAFVVLGGCPVPSTTTAPTQTATATADVTCLNTVQNRATVGGHVTKFSGNFTPTRGLLFNGTDNTIAGQQVAPDQFAGAFMTDVPVVCPPPSADHPITSGDIYVQQS